MALITCPECERDVSDQAEKCPNCGFPVQDMKQTRDPYEFASDQFDTKPFSPEDEKLRNYGLYSFILAIVSLFLPVPIVDAIIAVVAIVLAVKGLKASRRGFAVAGLVIGILALIGAVTLYASGDYYIGI